MPIIVYNTNTGTTEKYAKALSEKTGYDCIELSKAKRIDADEEIIFMSWIMGGSLEKFKDAKDKFNNIIAVCGVGMLPDEKNAQKVIDKNAISEKFFILSGGFDMKKLTGMHKMMMNMMIKQIKKTAGSAPSESQLEMIKLFEEGFDLYHQDKLIPLLEFLGK